MTRLSLDYRAVTRRDASARAIINEYRRVVWTDYPNQTVN